MAKNERDGLRLQRPALEQRAQTLRAVRAFFDARDFLEVETPVRIAAPAQESHIDAEPSGDRFLRASPELHMKRLLAAGYERIYQIGPCFRQGERGMRHNPEFTMLEWYRTGADYRVILNDTQALLRSLGKPALQWQGHTVDLTADWLELTVEQAFMDYAGWNPITDFDPDRFDIDMVERVEPALAQQARPVVLMDYPAPAAALARRRADRPDVAERWELYIAGIELANAYSELTDPDEQVARFATAAGERAALGKTVYPEDPEFMAALRAGLPPCGGIALGFDRLVMLLADRPDLDGVRLFLDPRDP